MMQSEEKVPSTFNVFQNISILNKSCMIPAVLSHFYHALLRTFRHLQISACGQFITNCRSGDRGSVFWNRTIWIEVWNFHFPVTFLKNITQCKARWWWHDLQEYLVLGCNNNSKHMYESSPKKWKIQDCCNSKENKHFFSL